MGRFLPTALSRLVVMKWDPTSPQTEQLITFLDRRATDRQYTAIFGGPASLSGSVWANDPEVNILFDDNFAAASGSPPLMQQDYPFLNEGVRLLRWFRKYRDQDDWTCRFGGHILDTVDIGDENTGRTRFTAWDPWQLLYRRLCYRVKCTTQDCSSYTDYAIAEDALPGPGGIRFPAGGPINEVITELLRRTIVLDGPTGIDAGTAWGGTAFYNGTIETLPNLAQDFVLQQGTSVGQAWQQLVEAAAAEIVLKPIYDPGDRPGYLCELNIYNIGASSVGTDKPFYWDRSGHDLTGIEHVVDGRERANNIKFYVGGPSAGKVPTQTQVSTDSITRYGNYWSVETREKTIDGDTVLNQAALDLKERRTGHETWTFTPTPEFTLRPFDDYNIGDYLDQYNSNRLRQEVALVANCRIQGFTINMSNEGVETVTSMELWDDVTSP